jgi:hypothetical protein
LLSVVSIASSPIKASYIYSSGIFTGAILFAKKQQHYLVKAVYFREK